MRFIKKANEDATYFRKKSLPDESGDRGEGSPGGNSGVMAGDIEKLTPCASFLSRDFGFDRIAPGGRYCR